MERQRTEFRPEFQKPHTAFIVGLGKIGFELDHSTHSPSRILTHSSSFLHHSRFELLGGVDPREENRLRFQKTYRLPAFSSLKALAAAPDFKPDIISIAVPTSEHKDVFAEVLKLKPKVILLEKPLAPSFSEAEAMLDAARAANVSVVVNYIRRFEPGVRTMKAFIEKAGLGDFVKGTVWYSKGLLNNASHFIDLLNFVFGPPEEIKLITNNPQRQTADDCEPDFMLRYFGAPIYFLSGREENYSVRSMQLLGSRGALRYSQGGAEIDFYPIEKSDLFSGYQFLSQTAEPIQTDFARYQYHVADALSDYLDLGLSLPSTGETALETMKITERIREECLKS